MSTSLKFLNVDVDVVGPAGSQALVHHFQNRAIILQNDSDVLSFEALQQHEDVKYCISSLVCIIRAMPPDLKLLWARSAARYFDIGYESNPNHHAVVAELSNASLQAMSEVGAQLRVTVYAGRGTSACNEADFIELPSLTE